MAKENNIRNIRLLLAYDGTAYQGWQKQKSSPRTIQSVLENTLHKILQEKVSVIGSGRTDAGVHAISQVANFRTCSKLPVKKITDALNALLPGDIRIIDAQEVEADFHARFQAKSKVYRYLILNGPYCPPQLSGQVYHHYQKLNLKKMQEVSCYLKGRHNFKAFCASGSSAKNFIRTIKRITIIKDSALLKAFGYTNKELSLINIEIEADGFLYNMVRAITGMLIEVGRGQLDSDFILKTISSKKRGEQIPTAPAKGLFLLKVSY